jgi:Fe-S cluster assembly protein SufD
VNAGLASYADAFERFSTGIPAAQRAARRKRLGEFLELGFPGRKAEDWRYTDLTGLATTNFADASSATASLKEAFLPRTDRLVYINGRLDKAQSTADELSDWVAADGKSDDGVIALNAAFARPGLNLKLGRNATIARILHIVIASHPEKLPTMSHQRHRIELGEAAEATVVFDFIGTGDGSRLVTHTLDIQLAAGARLRLYRTQNESAGATLLTRIDAKLARDSRLEATCIDGGRALARHDLNIELAGPGAETLVQGLFMPTTGAHIDNHTRIIHAAPHGRSRELFKGIVDERTRAVFNGKIVVQPGAQKTDSEQRVANLLLTRRAEVNAKPELEIYADDVKCAHGATVGQLDQTALGYLRSRGIDVDTARALLLHAFASEVLNKVEPAALRERLQRQLRLPASDDTLEIAA